MRPGWPTGWWEHAPELVDWNKWSAEAVLGPQCKRPGWPSNWRKVIPQLSNFFGWGPHEPTALTGTELAQWVADANEMIENREADNG